MEHTAAHSVLQVTSGTTGKNGGLLWLLVKIKQKEQECDSGFHLGSSSSRLHAVTVFGPNLPIETPAFGLGLVIDRCLLLSGCGGKITAGRRYLRLLPFALVGKIDACQNHHATNNLTAAQGFS